MDESYKENYFKLMNELLDIINRLQQIQKEAEENILNYQPNKKTFS